MNAQNVRPRPGDFSFAEYGADTLLDAMWTQHKYKKKEV